MPSPIIWPIEHANEGGINIDGVSTLVLDVNEKRADLELVNISEWWIFVSRGGPAALNEGIPLAPRGGSYFMEQAYLYNGAIYAIAAGGQGEAILTYSEGEWQL